MMTLLFTSGSHTSITAFTTSRAYSTSVPVKLSGEYSNEKFPSVSAASLLSSLAPFIAICLTSSLSLAKTCSLCATEVELYTWMTA